MPLSHQPLAHQPLASSLATRALSASSFSTTLAGKAALAVCASLFVALAAHASVPLFFTPVPLTLSDLAVLLVGLVLGPTVGFSALVLYLAEGATGLPVFSPHGPGGLAQLLGPTGGFLLSYPAAAALAGYLRSRLSVLPSRFLAALFAAAAGSALLMLGGVTWLGVLMHLAPFTALKLATVPFLPGQAVKIFAAAGIAVALRTNRRI